MICTDQPRNRLIVPSFTNQSRRIDWVIILGIDPGLQRTGYAALSAGVLGRPPIVLDAGIIRLTRGAKLEARLVELDDSLRELLTLHSPGVLACEALYAHYKHPRTAILMGHARGVVLCAASRAGLSVVHVSATNAKKMLTGSGHASKSQVQWAIANFLGVSKPPEPHDVADAISIALCGLQLKRAGDTVAIQKSPRPRRRAIAAGGPA